jgi:hypothetical protein
MYTLAIYSADYSDEFDCEGFGLFTNQEWSGIKSRVEKYFEDHGNAEVYFGSNEAMFFDSYENWESCFTVRMISEDEYQAIKLIPRYGRTFGTGNGIFSIGA